ncbi:MAG: Asp-tRNA(Asn)/Glu-tRNA(Gln) amidotransferase subunit GatC [Bdellovibrionales bacterium]
MKIDVEKVAQLAALKLTDQEIKTYGQQLSSILSHFNKITKVDTGNLSPMVTPTDIKNEFREDDVIHWENAETAVANAPEKSGNLFKVPPVV